MSIVISIVSRSVRGAEELSRNFLSPKASRCTKVLLDLPMCIVSSSILETLGIGVYLLPGMRNIAASAPSDTELASMWSSKSLFL